MIGHDEERRHIAAHLDMTKNTLKDSQTMTNTNLWSDETKLELFGVKIPKYGIIEAMQILSGCAARF